MTEPTVPTNVEEIQKMINDMEKPSLHFEFPPELERAPLKMTYGLEMDIRRLLPDPQTAVQLLLADPYTQDYVLRRCLTDTKKVVTKPDEELIPYEDIDLDSDTVDRLLMWAAEHAIYFFAKRTAGVANLGVQFAALMTPQPVPSSSGSENSTSKTPSAGDSTPSNPTSTESTGP
jgi:hypothetical protein